MQFGFLAEDVRLGANHFSEDLMIIELNDDDTRLLHTVLLEQAQEHLSYADTSEVAERLYRLATRFERPQTWAGVNAKTSLQRGIAVLIAPLGEAETRIRCVLLS